MTMKNLLVFLGGVATGVAGGVLATKQYFKKKYQEEADTEIDEMDQYFKKKYEDLLNLFDEEEKIEEPTVEKKSHKEKTQYDKAYHGANDLTDEEKEDLDSLLENPTDEEIGEAMTKEHLANKNRSPRIISEESLADIPPYFDQKVLFFYRLDDVVTDEEDEVIDDPDYLLGDCLDKYNFRESDEKLIFVQNFALDTVYEVQKINAAHYDEG